MKVLKKNQQIHTYQVVPWNSELKADEHDAFFLSNGPGDPQVTIINFDQTYVAQAGLFFALFEVLLLSNDCSIYILWFGCGQIKVFKFWAVLEKNMGTYVLFCTFWPNYHPLLYLLAFPFVFRNLSLSFTGVWVGVHRKLKFCSCFINWF